MQINKPAEKPDQRYGHPIADADVIVVLGGDGLSAHHAREHCPWQATFRMNGACRLFDERL